MQNKSTQADETNATRFVCNHSGKPRNLTCKRILTSPCLLREEVVEGFYGVEFVVFDVEDGVELGDVEDVVDFLGEVEELEFAAGVADGGEAADEFSDAGAVEVIDVGEVEDDLLFALGDQ